MLMIVLLGWLALGLLIAWLLVFILAYNDLFWCFVEEGDIRFVMRGKTLHRIIMNAKGWHLDGGLVKKNDENAKPSRGNWLGLYWIGIPPFYRIHRYVFQWDRRIEGDEYATKPDQDNLSSLHLSHTYRIVVKNVSLADAYRIDVSINVILRALDPNRAVLQLKAKWFAAITTAIQGAMADEVNNYFYETATKAKTPTGEDRPGWLELEKSSPSSPFVRAIMRANDVGKAKDAEDQKTLGAGIRDAVGMEIEAVEYNGFKLSEEQEDAVKAIQAEETAKLNAKAKIAEAEGTAEAKRKVGEAEAHVLARKRAAVGEPVLIAQQWSEGIAAAGVQVLTLNGPGPTQTVPVAPGSSAPAPRQPR